jgi:hypothetical protein
MRMAPPRVPTAATAAFVVGPRFLPGRYTVKLTEGDSQYTTTLRMVGDSRASHTVADRKAQFALSVTLYDLMNQMTTVVDRMNDMRESLGDRGTGLSAADSLLRALTKGSAQVDTMRKKIVATKEGGAVTGEERIREHADLLYGALMTWEGRPARYQLERIDVLRRELTDVAKEVDDVLRSENLDKVPTAMAQGDTTIDASAMAALRCVLLRGPACQENGRAIGAARERQDRR